MILPFHYPNPSIFFKNDKHSLAECGQDCTMYKADEEPRESSIRRRVDDTRRGDGAGQELVEYIARAFSALGSVYAAAASFYSAGGEGEGPSVSVHHYWEVRRLARTVEKTMTKRNKKINERYDVVVCCFMQ